jgi:hypothetical protein
MFIKNLNDAQYVRTFEDTFMGDILMVWFGSDLITLLDGETLEEFNCFHQDGITDWRDAYGAMTGHMDTMEDENREELAELDRKFEAKTAQRVYSFEGLADVVA